MSDVPRMVQNDRTSFPLYSHQSGAQNFSVCDLRSREARALSLASSVKKRLRKYKLLPDYFTAIAAQWQEILWGAGMPAVIMIVWWSLGHPPKGVTIGYFVLAMFVAGYLTWLADHLRLMPALGIKGFHIQETPIMSSMGFASEKQRAYLQIVPRLANAPVRECQGYLLRVSKDADGGWQETPMNEPLVLEWSLHEELSLTLHPGIQQRLNVCFWDEQRVITPAIVGQLPLRWFAVPNSVGKFRFDVRIISIDCEPVDVSIAMTLDNRTWNDPEVMLLEV